MVGQHGLIPAIPGEPALVEVGSTNGMVQIGLIYISFPTVSVLRLKILYIKNVSVLLV